MQNEVSFTFWKFSKQKLGPFKGSFLLLWLRVSWRNRRSYEILIYMSSSDESNSSEFFIESDISSSDESSNIGLYKNEPKYTEEFKEET